MKKLPEIQISFIFAVASWPLFHYCAFKALMSLSPHEPSSAIGDLLLLVGMLGIIVSIGIALSLFKENIGHALSALGVNVLLFLFGVAVILQ